MKVYLFYVYKMSLLTLPEEIMDNIIKNITDCNLYIFRTINREMNIILTKDIDKRSQNYGGIIGFKYNI